MWHWNDKYEKDILIHEIHFILWPCESFRNKRSSIWSFKETLASVLQVFLCYLSKVRRICFFFIFSVKLNWNMPLFLRSFLYLRYLCLDLCNCLISLCIFPMNSLKHFNVLIHSLDPVGGRALQTQNALQRWLPFLTTQMWVPVHTWCIVSFYVKEQTFTCSCLFKIKEEKLKKYSCGSKVSISGIVSTQMNPEQKMTVPFKIYMFLWSMQKKDSLSHLDFVKKNKQFYRTVEMLHIELDLINACLVNQGGNIQGSIPEFPAVMVLSISKTHCMLKLHNHLYIIPCVLQ